MITPPTRSLFALAAASIALAIFSSACLGLQRKGATAPSPSSSNAYGGDLDLDDEALKIDEPAKTKTGAPVRGTLLVQLVDTNRAPIAGAVLRYRGEGKGTAVTDRSGVATFKLPAGTYSIDVMKCGRTVVVDDVAEANATIVAGRTKRGQLEVDASQVTPRYQPTNSATSSEPAPWSQGDTIALAVRFDDTCTFERAPSVGIGAYEWRASGNLRIIRTPERTGRDGSGAVEVACTGAGDATLELFHPRTPDSTVDVLASLPNPAFGEWCA